MNRFGIRVRVLLLALVPMLLIALALSWYFTYSRIGELDRALEQQAVVQARHLARASEYSLFVGERAHLSSLANELRRDTAIRAVAIVDQAGDALVRLGPMPPISDLPRTDIYLDQRDPSVVVVGAPVQQTLLAIDDPVLGESTSALIGYVALSISKEETRRRQHEMLIDSLIITFVGMVLAALLALRLGRDVIRPIVTLAEAIRRIGAGDLNVRVETHTGGEFAQLEQGINQMSAELRASYDNLQDRIRDATARLTWQANHDALTGLTNRREFERHVEQSLASVQLRGERHTLLYLDLDQFKIVNDTSGHSAGDELLKQLSVLLKRELRDSDILARLGGDEFGVLLHQCDESVAHRLAERMRRVVDDFRFYWEGRTYSIGVSIGLVEIDDGWASLGKLLSAADAACYAAKDAGRNRIHTYREGDAELVRRQGEMEWATRLNLAVSEDRLFLFAQRIEPLGENAEMHYELLLRLRDEDGNTVPPMAFIPAAERYQLMPMLDRFVLDQALSLCAPAAKAQQFWLNINLSAASLGDAAFQGYLLAALQARPELAAHLCFEITETAAMANLENLIRLMTELRQLGCRFAVDDFGSGLSSFGYLRTLPVDYLKIDGAFIRDLVEDPIDLAMVEAIQNVARLLDIKTMAGYVENAETLEKLRVLGVDYVQGDFIQAPFTTQECLLAVQPGQATT